MAAFKSFQKATIAMKKHSQMKAETCAVSVRLGEIVFPACSCSDNM